jgi:hypothetical protein
LAGLAFPYLKKNTFEASPASQRFGGVPLITICGVVAAVFTGYITVRTIVDVNFGASSDTSLLLNAAVPVAALLWYFGFRWFRSRQGLDLSRRMGEIPVE